MEQEDYGRSYSGVDDPFEERSQPASIEAERTVLGAILLDNAIFFEDIADLTAEDFYLDSHIQIFRVMNEILNGLVEECHTVSIVTLATELTRRKKTGSVGGVSYLASLTEGLPHRLAVGDEVRIIKDKSQSRRLINLCSRAISRANDQSERSSEIIADVQNELIDEAAEGDSAAVRVGEVTPAVEKRVEKFRDTSSERTALEMTWGIAGLDAHTKGIFSGELTVIGGESGGGKTALATQIALANAREGTGVGIFSLEMSKEKLVQRFYPQMGAIITADHMRDPRLINLHTHVPEVKRLSAELRGLPIWIDETNQLPIRKMVSRTRMMRRKFNIRLFFVDFLQLIEHGSARSEVEGITHTMLALRDLVDIEPDIHIIVLSQYSKDQGSQFSKKRRRTRGSLYGASAIHFSAQNVLLVTMEDAKEKDRNDLLDVEFDFDKQREGRIGKVHSMYDRDHLLFTYPQPPLTH